MTLGSSLFILAFILSMLLLLTNIKIGAVFFGIYFLIIFIDSLLKNKNLGVAVISIATTLIQFAGYGIGFLKGLLETD